MSSKDKEKTLQDRLKQFFRLNKGGTGKKTSSKNLPARGLSSFKSFCVLCILIIFLFLGNFKGRVDFSLTREIEDEIGPESSVHHRVKVIKELSDAVLQNHLEEVRALPIIPMQSLVLFIQIIKDRGW